MLIAALERAGASIVQDALAAARREAAAALRVLGLAGAAVALALAAARMFIEDASAKARFRYEQGVSSEMRRAKATSIVDFSGVTHEEDDL